MMDAYRMNESDGWRDAGGFFEGMAVLALSDVFEGDPSGIGLLPAAPVAGEPAWVFVRDAGQGAGDAELSWEQGDARGAVRLSKGDGVSCGKVLLPREGRVRLTARGATREAMVRTPLSVENVHFRTDEDLLRDIAAATDGRFVQLGTFDPLAAGIEPRKQIEVRVREYSLWHRTWLLLGIVALATAEYLMRRRAGKVM